MREEAKGSGKREREPVELSVVIPLFNEAENLPSLAQALFSALSRFTRRWEVIFVDDGSMDGTWEGLLDIKAASPHPEGVTLVRLSRNFGQHPALAAGMTQARGDMLVTMDGDLQCDPQDIAGLLRPLREGCDFVSGVRRGRRESWWLRRLPSRMAGAIMGRVTGRRLRDYGCPLNALKAELARAMGREGEKQRFFKALAVMLAARVAEVEVTHRPRLSGRSRYGTEALLDLFFDFVTHFARHLFQKVALAGMGLFGLSLLLGALYLLLRFPLGILDEPFDRLQALLLIGLLSGIQLLVLGVLGEFVVRIHRRLPPRPLYEIAEVR